MVGVVAFPAIGDFPENNYFPEKGDFLEKSEFLEKCDFLEKDDFHVMLNFELHEYCETMDGEFAFMFLCSSTCS